MSFEEDNRVFPNFPNLNIEFDDQEEVCCEQCELTEEYFNEVIEADSQEAVLELLHGLVGDTFQSGYASALQDDIDAKTALLSNAGRRY